MVHWMHEAFDNKNRLYKIRYEDGEDEIVDLKKSCLSLKLGLLMVSS